MIAEKTMTKEEKHAETSGFVVEDLQLFYGTNHALKDINITMEDKKITALIGPSGCGKSSFLNCLNRMTELIPSARVEGKIRLGGVDIHKEMNPIVLRQKVGMVFQQPNPFPMSIYDNIVYGPRIRGVKSRALLDEICERALKEAAIWDEVKDRLKTSALSLSGGQQQRICIARALAAEPEALLMDEPTSALDPVSTAKIEELCLRLKEHYNIIIVTHNMQQAARISDQTAFFLTGDLIEVAPTDKLFSNPEDKRTEDYITGRFG